MRKNFKTILFTSLLLFGLSSLFVHPQTTPSSFKQVKSSIESADANLNDASESIQKSVIIPAAAVEHFGRNIKSFQSSESKDQEFQLNSHLQLSLTKALDSSFSNENIQSFLSLNKKKVLFPFHTFS